MTGTVSPLDEEYLCVIRENVEQFIASGASKYDREGTLILDVAPQVHRGARAHFVRAEIRTLDIDPAAGCDYTADLCRDNSDCIPAATFDVILCTEVLEHTLNPFHACLEMFRILKPRGVALITTPFNFRLHGPLPDCWRFTEHGLRALLKDFDILDLAFVETPGRGLMPIHYSVVASKPATTFNS